MIGYVVLKIQSIYQFNKINFAYLIFFLPEKYFPPFFTFPVTVSVTVKVPFSPYADATSAILLKSNAKLFKTPWASSFIGCYKTVQLF